MPHIELVEKNYLFCEYINQSCKSIWNKNIFKER